LVAFEVRSILAPPFPGPAGTGSTLHKRPLFLVLLAGTYFVMARLSVDSLSEPLTRTGVMYFTVTVLSTVAFGHITARTETARLVVTGQMIADLVVLRLAIKIIALAVKRGRAASAARRRRHAAH